MSDLGQSAKADVRARILAGRRSAPLQARARAAAAIRDTLGQLVRRQRPAVATAYIPMGTEPGGDRLPEVFGGCRLLLPVLLPDLDLDWAAYAGPESLVPGGHGTRAPAGPRLGPAAIGAATLVVVPALAVDSSGVRLGRGGGSYDRALARAHPDALTIALLYDGELVPALPAEPHDAQVSAVITPSAGLVRLPTSAGRTPGP